jgi:uncharacterized membrane protein YhaH (DUF805 family)
MDFGTAISTCFKKYIDFSGRARRSEYWFFYLFYLIAIFASSIVSESLPNLVFFVFILPMISAATRRMHDVGKSGWFQLIPIYGLILAASDSEAGSNQYGEAVKY